MRRCAAPISAGATGRGRSRRCCRRGSSRRGSDPSGPLTRSPFAQLNRGTSLRYPDVGWSFTCAGCGGEGVTKKSTESRLWDGACEWRTALSRGDDGGATEEKKKKKEETEVPGVEESRCDLRPRQKVYDVYLVVVEAVCMCSA